MRKVVLMMSVSLDGFMEGPDREIDWHRVDDELLAHMNGWLGRAGAFLDGRVTYELMAGYWPAVAADPQAAALAAEFAKIWRETPKYVFTRSAGRPDWDATVLHEVDPAFIAQLKRQDGGDLVLGGADLAVSFLDLGLVDEYRVYVHPVVIGRGRPLFRRPDAFDALELVETHRFGNGVVLLRYATA